ncbi:hypothetical protein G7046_g10042 [Stylonectria norvegica]|nr:hypothetical protein G7046_g10042 [Stylonectria norvegica]
MRSLAAHVTKALPKYARPVFLRVMAEMGGGQITGTNKQQKHLLREAGVRPGGDEALGVTYWLRGDSYVPFEEKDWKELEAARVR